jgi:hypothetical protein
MDLTSATEGLWRDVTDTIADEQKFKATQEGKHLKFADSETQLVGIPDAGGVIRGDFIHQGVGGGSFVLTPESPEPANDDEAGFLQLDIHKNQKVKVDDMKVHSLKAGTSYTGELEHPSFPKQDIVIRMDLTSATEGLWKDVDDEIDDEQKFKVTQDGKHLKFADSESQLIGIPDADGVIKGDFIHQGVGGGSFILMPESPEPAGDDEAGFLQLDIHKNQC